MASAPGQFLTLEQFDEAYRDKKPYFEYWFGEAIQKSMPTSSHGSFQILLGMLLMARGWKAASEVRLKLSTFANPILDLVADPNPIECPYPTRPFALCVEILSPGDDLPRVFQKGAHYLDWGIQTVWIIDPDLRKAYCMNQTNPQPVQIFMSDYLSAQPELAIPVRELFDQLDALSV
jgi:Uma2 family endonuclease